MSKSALKFLQAYVKEMVELGGENLPRTISAKLGANLGRIYRKRGITEIESGLNQSFKVLKTKYRIEKKSDNLYEIEVKYRRKFCVIGGKFDKKRKGLIQKAICVPYYLGFLKELDPTYTYKINVHSCVVSDNTHFCKYSLMLTKQE